MKRDAEPTNLILTHDKLDLPSSREGILASLRRILAKPFVQKIILDSEGYMDVSWYRDPTDSLENGPVDEDPDVTISRIELRESAYQKSAPKENLVDCLTELALAGSCPTHIICTSVRRVEEWVGLPPMVRLPVKGGFSYYLGLKMVELNSLPEDILIICASLVQTADLADAQEGIKILMEAENVREIST